MVFMVPTRNHHHFDKDWHSFAFMTEILTTRCTQGILTCLIHSRKLLPNVSLTRFFGDEIKNAALVLLWSQNDCRTGCSYFFPSCFATKESRGWKPNIHFVCIPAQKVVINDFSTAAVKSFLKFLYSGSIDMPVERLVEVSVIADKYQVMELNKLCLTELQDSFFFKAMERLID